MGNRGLDNWRQWLSAFSVGLLIFAAFGPLSGTLDKILTLVAAGGIWISLVTDSPAFRQEAALFLTTLTALVLLALLVSIDPKWVLFGSVGIWCGISLWGVLRQEHAEYSAERKRLR